MKILLVEDHCDIADALAEFLADEGHAVTVSRSGEQALAALASEGARFACIVLDHFMPGMSGVDLVREATRAGAHAGELPPVILITTNPELVDLSQLGGRVTILPKPLDIYELAQTIEKVGGR